MEVGKLKSSGPSSIFYFIVDPLTPDEPNHSRLQYYFVVSHLDSYVEAFNFLCRTLCVPATDSSLRRWHSVYSKVFGGVTYDSFCRAIQTLPIRHFHLETSESAARAYVSAALGGGGVSSSGAGDSKRVSPPRGRRGPDLIAEHAAPSASHRDTTMLLYPQRDNDDPALQLHRIKAELQEVQGQLRMEQSKSKVNGLGDAERTALMYKLESAQKELESEKIRSKETSDRLRQQIQALQQRMDKLLNQHDDNLEALAAAEKQHFSNLEETFLKRETEMKEEFENAVRERDRKLMKMVSKSDTLELQLAQALKECESLREENSKLSSSILQTKSDREQEEGQFRRLRLQYEAMESHRISQERDLQRWEEEQRRAEAEIARLRVECAKWKREADRFHHFTSSLQTELKDLDHESAAAADILRKKVLRERQQSAHF